MKYKYIFTLAPNLIAIAILISVCCSLSNPVNPNLIISDRAFFMSNIFAGAVESAEALLSFTSSFLTRNCLCLT